MQEKMRVARNAGFAMASETLTKLLVIVGGIIIARYLGRERFGVYSYAMSVVWLAMVFTDLGMSTHITREVARVRGAAEKFLPAGLGLRMSSGVFLMAALLVAAPWLAPGKEAVAALRWTAPSLVLAPLGAYYILFRATERLDLAAIVQVVSQVVIMAAIVAAWQLNLGIKGVIIASLAGYASTAVMVFALVSRHYEKPRVSFDVRRWLYLVTRGFPFLAMSILSEIYNRIDHIFIPFLDSVAANGLYGVASRMSLMFTVVPNAAAAAVFPYFARRSAESKEPLRNGTLALYRHLGIIGFGAAVFVGVPAAGWLRVLFGSQYMEGAPALAVLMAATPLMFFHAIHISALYALEKQNVVLWYTLFSIGLDVALDIILIMKMGFVGAAYATLATNAAFFIFSYIALRKELDGRLPFLQCVYRPAIAAAASGACLYMASSLHIAIRMSIAMPIFLVLLIATKSLTREDVTLYTSMLRKKTATHNS